MLIAALTPFTTSPELSPLAYLRRFASSMNTKLGTWASTLPARISLLRSLISSLRYHFVALASITTSML